MAHILYILSFLPAIAASPISSEVLRKRGSPSHSIGMGFGIAICFVVFGTFIFYLGVRRGRSGSWFCWRNPALIHSRTPSRQTIHEAPLKTRISSPTAIHSTALPELSPITALPRYAELSPLGEKPRALELSAADKTVYEMGLASPRRPPSVASTGSIQTRKSGHSLVTAYRKSLASVKTSAKSVYSTHERPPKVNSGLDRKSWFCKDAMMVEDQDKKVKNEEEVVGLSGIVPPVPAVVNDKRETGMDWSGMEWMSRMYSQRKSKRLSGLRSFYME